MRFRMLSSEARLWSMKRACHKHKYSLKQLNYNKPTRQVDELWKICRWQEAWKERRIAKQNINKTNSEITDLTLTTIILNIKCLPGEETKTIKLGQESMAVYRKYMLRAGELPQEGSSSKWEDLRSHIQDLHMHCSTCTCDSFLTHGNARSPMD